MDIGKAFSFVFDDDRWVTKILIAAAIVLGGILFSWLIIPAIAAAALITGYGVEVTRRVIAGHWEPLPEWEDWGGFLVDGLKVVVIGIVYALPMILAGICLGIPIGVLGEESPELSSVFSAVLSCLNILWGLVIGLFLPAAIAFYAADDQRRLSSAFRFGDVLSFVRDNFTTYLVVLVLGWVTSLIGGLGFAFCFFPGLATAPYATIVNSHLYGQAYLEGQGKAVSSPPTPSPASPPPAVEEEEETL